MKIEKYIFQQHGDTRGQLIALEEKRDIPFKIKRVYYMYDTGKTVRRGYHSHKTLKQILVCVHGECKVLLNDGMETETLLLNTPYEGIYVGPNIWREMYDFSNDAVLMVFASEYYNEEDYIRNYDDFIKSIHKKDN